MGRGKWARMSAIWSWHSEGVFDRYHGLIINGVSDLVPEDPATGLRTYTPSYSQVQILD